MREKWGNGGEDSEWGRRKMGEKWGMGETRRNGEKTGNGGKDAE